MRVRTHLIAMPWAPPDVPSVQVACLKAHLDRVTQRLTDCRTYSAFFSILHELTESSFRDFYAAAAVHGEYVYQALHLRRFGPPGQPSTMPLASSMLDGLERATRTYLDRRVVPSLIARGLNLVGFTLNYDQVYASLYAAEHLRRRLPDRHFLFVYGGGSASFPNVYQLLVDLGVTGVVVIGEGERKLELLVRTLEGLPPTEAPKALAAVAGLDPGIIVIGEPLDLATRDPARHATQIANLGELALPDYDEYFAALRRACADERTYAAARAATPVVVEGSRGCFGRCDFCAMHRNWNGFRTRTAHEILRDTLALARKHHTSHVQFADNVCDAWAGDYARLLIGSGLHQPSFMELRAGHPEEFWTQLALAGVDCIQVGVEALSSPLLRAIGKGTGVVKNLTAHKYLTELDIKSGNNLITHHPASTLADVRETRRILRQIPHWGPFRLTRFRLMAGSPLYERLSREERVGLRQTRSCRLPARAARHALEYAFELPERLRLASNVRRAWDVFERAYERTAARNEVRQPRLDVTRVARNTLRITDTRDGGMRVHDVSGAAARVYEACHRGLTLDEIVQATGLPLRAVGTELGRFVRSTLVLRVDDHYVSLARRPRDELARRFLAANARGSQPRDPGVVIR